MIFDTGSDWLMIESKECVEEGGSCQGNAYDQDESSFFFLKSRWSEARNFGTIISLTGY